MKKLILTFFTSILTLTALAGVPNPEGGSVFLTDTLLFNLDDAPQAVGTLHESEATHKFSPSEERKFLRGRSGFSFSNGWNGNFYRGKMTSYLGAMHDYTINVGFINDGFRVYGDMCFGGAGRLRKGGFSRDGYTWQEGETVSGLKFSVFAGYRILELGRVSFIPFFGVGATVLSQGTGEYDYDSEGDSYEITSDSGALRYFGGLRVDLPFARLFSKDPSGVRYSSAFGDVFEYGLALSFYVAKENYSVPCPATSINVGIQLYFSTFSIF
ncbi:MAG: hypothetical protein IJR77_06755 [Bacteroidales bacterium]|nr:hypothetical protein [Bacteroidales bacterium]